MTLFCFLACLLSGTILNVASPFSGPPEACPLPMPLLKLDPTPQSTPMPQWE